MYKSRSRFLVVIFFVAIWACPLTVCAQGNEVEFDNQSGQLALVKLIGPSMREVNVPINSKLSVTALPGKYHIMVRYGTSENYQYTKGEKFEVKETATQKSITTITLHKVVGGNYDAKPISEDEFAASLTNTENTKEVNKDKQASGKGQDLSHIPADLTSLTLKGTLVQQDGTPAGNIKVYLQKTFFPDNDKTRVRTQFTSNDKGELTMPFGITDKHGNFSVKIQLEQVHLNFALSLRQGRASLDFPIIKLFELTKEAWERRNKHVFHVGKLSPPEGWEIVHFEKGNY